jgi:hypothetical protein
MAKDPVASLVSQLIQVVIVVVEQQDSQCVAHGLFVDANQTKRSLHKVYTFSAGGSVLGKLHLRQKPPQAIRLAHPNVDGLVVISPNVERSMIESELVGAVPQAGDLRLFR